MTCLSDELAAVLVLLSPAGAALLADEPQPTSVAPAYMLPLPMPLSFSFVFSSFCASIVLVSQALSLSIFYKICDIGNSY